MTNAKIEFRLGGISFAGEGDEKWIAEQLDKILTQAPHLLTMAPSETSAANPDAGGENPKLGKGKLTLAKFLQAKSIKSEKDKFLATAIWLHGYGHKRLASKDVVKALKDSNQSKLRNPAQCLSRNVNKGFCEKDGKQFFVTDDGRKQMPGG